MFSGIITGIGVKDVTIYGEGTIDGNASWDNWWFEAEKDPDCCKTAYDFF